MPWLAFSFQLMATIKEQNENGLAAARTLQAQLSANLTASGNSSDLIAVIVPVRFAVTLQANPGSALTTEELRDLAESFNFTLYEP